MRWTERGSFIHEFKNYAKYGLNRRRKEYTWKTQE